MHISYTEKERTDKCTDQKRTTEERKKASREYEFGVYVHEMLR